MKEEESVSDVVFRDMAGEPVRVGDLVFLVGHQWGLNVVNSLVEVVEPDDNQRRLYPHTPVWGMEVRTGKTISLMTYNDFTGELSLKDTVLRVSGVREMDSTVRVGDMFVFAGGVCQVTGVAANRDPLDPDDYRDVTYRSVPGGHVGDLTVMSGYHPVQYGARTVVFRGVDSVAGA